MACPNPTVPLSKEKALYTVRISHVPAPGKGPQLRAALEEHSKAANAAGGSYGLSQRLYAPEAVFVNTLRYENLAALEAYNATALNDPARMARLAKVGEFVARPQTPELNEILVPGRPTGEVNYVLRITNYAVAGKAGELVQVLEKRASIPVKGTVGIAISTQVVSTDGPNFSTNVLFSSLAGIEEFRNATRADASFREFGAQMSTLTARPPRSELHRVLMRPA